jgi:isoleucyl-tRNA synthetase
MPYLADEIYRNLVLSVDPQAPESIHLADWPIWDESLIDEGLNQDMRLVMKLASLGHAARNNAGIKVRQPLPQAAFLVGALEDADLVDRFADLIADELNVKEVTSLGSQEDVLSYQLVPLPRQLGQKYQSRFPAVREAIMSLDAQEAAQALRAGVSLKVEVLGESLQILPEEVEVRAIARSGRAVASDGPYLVALSTDVTPELFREGLAREFVRRVQNLRRQAGLKVVDRISLWYRASPELAEAVEIHRRTIMEETLSVEMAAGEPPSEASRSQMSFDEQKLTIGMIRA